jgi:hypothetical protein
MSYSFLLNVLRSCISTLAALYYIDPTDPTRILHVIRTVLLKYKDQTEYKQVVVTPLVHWKW